jgi:hypothetical protein
MTQVVNHTLVVKDDAEFRAMYDIMPGTQRFNDTFGDCYISGKLLTAALDTMSQLTFAKASSREANSTASFLCVS